MTTPPPLLVPDWVSDEQLVEMNKMLGEYSHFHGVQRCRDGERRAAINELVEKIVRENVQPYFAPSRPYIVTACAT